VGESLAVDFSLSSLKEFLKMKRRGNQKGFTLIELIITIVIIGVLAAVAIPKFQNLSNDAEKGVAAGVAGSLASALSVNYARSRVPGAVAGTDYRAITSCADIQTNLAALVDAPAGYTVTGTVAAAIVAGTPAVGTGVAQGGCLATSPAGVTAAFNAYGA
jgi:MSHA pilin protein MshA